VGGGEEAWGRVTGRDLEVLEFVARFGVVPRDAVAKWAGTARTMTARREKRLREAGLFRVEKRWGAEAPVLLAIADGLAVCGRDELSPARFSQATAEHFAATTRLAAALETEGKELLSERELLAHERALGEKQF
jgi:hypothetical protein